MSNVVLVYPKVPMTGRYYSLARWVTVPPQGIAYLASVLRRDGHKVRIIDAWTLKWDSDRVVREVFSAPVDVVGFSATSLIIKEAAATAKLIKDINPKMPIMVGNVHVSVLPEETMALWPQFDIAVIGEGERTISEVVKALETGGGLDRIPGLGLRDGNGGIRFTPRRELIRDLDAIPFPAWDLLPDLVTYYKHVVLRVNRLPSASIIATRGCPRGRCIFCSRDFFHKVARAHSGDYIHGMIRYLISRWGIRSLNFEDDDLLAFRKSTRRLCELIIENKTDITWAINTRVNYVEPEILKLMKQAGCWSLSFGIESGDQRILDFIQKDITKEEITRAVRLTREAGLAARGFFMIGHPTETPESIRKTIDFIKQLDLDYFSMSFTVPLPGTRLWEIAKQHGTFDSDFSGLNVYNPVFVPEGLTREYLEKKSKQIYRMFYFRPKTVWRLLKRTVTSGYLGAYLKDGLRFFWGFLLRRGG